MNLMVNEILNEKIVIHSFRFKIEDDDFSSFLSTKKKKIRDDEGKKCYQ